MNTRSFFRGLGVGMAAAAILTSQTASASTESCTRAHAAGQREENAGQLKEALASFQACASDAECPLPIRNECTQLYTTVEGRLPTLVFSVIDGNGNDLVDVQTWSGDALIVSRLDGRPIAMNPGLHALRFELPTGEVLTKSVVVRQGEKDRIVSLTLTRGDVRPPDPSDVASERSAPSPGTTTKATDARLRVPLGSWIAYGVGVAALGAWGTLTLLGRSEESTLDKCSPNCASAMQGDYDAMKRHYLIADVSLGVAGAAAIAGTVVLLTMGRRSKVSMDRVAPATKKRALSLSPVALGRVGWGLTLGGRY